MNCDSKPKDSYAQIHADSAQTQRERECDLQTIAQYGE